MTDVSQPNSANSTVTAGPDPLHNLYRMSRTAGLGSGDYVAINNTAILALILGFASIMSLLFDVMLIVALAAVICGVLALAQIRSSNGTQSGRVFAVLGILLGLGFGGWGASNIAMARVKHRSDERAIGQVVKRLNDLLTTGQYGQAYESLFSETFKKDFNEELFNSRWEAFTTRFGAVKSVGWGEKAHIEQTRGTDFKRAWASSEISFKNVPEGVRQPIVFVFVDAVPNDNEPGEWQIEGIEQLFDKPKAPDGSNAPPLDPSRPAGPEFTPPAPENQPQQPPAPAQGV